MREGLDFGCITKSEGARIEDWFGDSVICSRCGATLATYPDKCNVPLDKPCLGFLTVEGARLHIRRRVDA